MSIVIGSYSERFFAARSLSETLEAFYPSGEDSPSRSARSSRSRSLEQDFLEISPFNDFRRILEDFKRNGAPQGRLSVELSTTSIEQGSPLQGTTLDRDLDLMLRLLATDEEDYQRLRSRFDEMFKAVQGGGNAPAPAPQAGSTTGTAEAAPPAEAPALSPGTEGATVQANSVAAAVTAVQRRTTTVRAEFQRQDSRLEATGVQIKQADPLVLDLNGDGLDLTAAGQGAMFDVNADGKLDWTGWVKGDNALLTLDRNGNGQIDDGGELFGDQHGADDGFQELAKFDDNGDRRIDIKDRVYKALELYRDLDGNGRVDTAETMGLKQAGIASLNLQFLRDQGSINGNQLLLKSTFERTDGRQGTLADVLFGFREA